MSKKATPLTGLNPGLSKSIPFSKSENSKLDISTGSKASGRGKFSIKGVVASALTKELKKPNQKPTLSNNSLNESNNDNLLPKTMSDNKPVESIETKILKIIDESSEMFTNKNYFTNQEASGEKYELVEKEILRKFELDNEELKLLKNTHGEKYNDLILKHGISVNELKKIKAKFRQEEKTQEEDNNKIFEIEQSNKEIILYNQKLRDMYTKELNEKENIYKVIVAFLKKFDASLSKDIKKTLKGFTHEMFLPMDKKKEDQEKIKDLNAKLKKLEKESMNLDSEIEIIKKTLNDEKNKNTYVDLD